MTMYILGCWQCFWNSNIWILFDNFRINDNQFFNIVKNCNIEMKETMVWFSRTSSEKKWPKLLLLMNTLKRTFFVLIMQWRYLADKPLEIFLRINISIFIRTPTNKTQISNYIFNRKYFFLTFLQYNVTCSLSTIITKFNKNRQTQSFQPDEHTKTWAKKFTFWDERYVGDNDHKNLLPKKLNLCTFTTLTTEKFNNNAWKIVNSPPTTQQIRNNVKILILLGLKTDNFSHYTFIKISAKIFI